VPGLVEDLGDDAGRAGAAFATPPAASGLMLAVVPSEARRTW
jgi:hypothetical protein